MNPESPLAGKARTLSQVAFSCAPALPRTQTRALSVFLAGGLISVAIEMMQEATGWSPGQEDCRSDSFDSLGYWS